MAITLSHARPSDVGDISGLLRTSWAATYAHFLSADELNGIALELHDAAALRRQISDPRVRFLVARAGGSAIVGIATVVQSEDETMVSVLRLYVLPEYQGQGIGTKLLNDALAGFPSTRRLELQVAEGNPSGLSFWTNRGFRECGREEVLVGSTTLGLISMERTVAA